jgi:sugar lactone lactonase YvrE
MPCPELITGSAPRLHPEGVTYAAAHDAFLVGSVTHGTVSVVEPGGTVRTLVDDPALITTMGLAVDATRGRLLVVNADIGFGDRSTAGSVDKTAGLGSYDVHSGQRIACHDLAALDPGRRHRGNDVTTTDDGTTFVTDSFSGAIYRVPLDGEPSVLLRDDRLMPAGNGNGANGIVSHPGGFLLVAQSAGRALYKLAGGTLTRVAVDTDIGAPDGLLLDGDGALHAVDNSAANRVVTLRSGDGWATASVAASRPWPDPAPTTMTHSPCGIYVLSGRLDQLPNGTELFLRRLPDG